MAGPATARRDATVTPLHAAGTPAPAAPRLSPTVARLRTHSVDDWGRDPQLQRMVAAIGRLRWNISVGGDQRLPVRHGALLVVNHRRGSLAGPLAALAIAEVIDRPVRFVGRPEIAPFGPFLRRLGGLLDLDDEIGVALADGELVVVTTAATSHPRHAGEVRPRHLLQATRHGASVHPVALLTSMVTRSARVEIGSPVSHRRVRRGPLGEVELAEHVRRSLQSLLDSMGGVQTGVAAVDWIAEG